MKQLLRFKTFLILALLAMVGNSAWAQSTSTLTFSAKCNGSGTADDGVSWTVTSDGSESNFDSNKGIHYGTGSQQVQYIKLSTSQIVGTITSVVVNASTASGVSATVDVTVGGEAFGGNPQSLSASAANYTFNGSASGEIVVTVTKPSKATKAIYVKSVAVTYTSGGSSTLDPNDLALTGAPVALSFDLYNNATPQVVNYTTSSTGAVTIADNDYATFGVDQTNKTITVTPTAVTPSTQTVMVVQDPDETYASGFVTFTFDIADTTPSDETWEATALADLTADDVFVIVGNNGNNFALANDNGTGSAPSAVGVTVSDGKITSKVSDNIKWTVSGDATNGYTFYPAGSTETWLYCTATNNGVRVGTNDNKTFTVSTEGYLKHSGTNRYLGVYNSQDWRCYTEPTANNIKDQTFTFYRYVDPTVPQKANPELAFAETKFTINLGDAFTAPALTFVEGFDGTVTYESSNTAVATVGPSGIVTIEGAGTTTITASSAETENYRAATASYTLTVVDPNGPGTENNPYTVAEARAAIDAGTGMTGVYAKGIVSEIVTAYNSKYGNITYNISADGTTTADQLQAYRGKSYNGEDFTSEDDIQVGDTVVIYGTLKKYNTTYEFDANNQLVSLKRPVVAVPTIGLSTTTVNAEAAGANGTIDVTYANFTAANPGIELFEADGATPAKYDWLTASFDDDATIVYSIQENTTTEARTAYFKSYAMDGETKVYSDLVTVAQAGVVIDYATLPFSFDGGRADIETTAGLTQEGLDSDYASSPKLKFNGTGDYVILKFNERPGTLTFDIKGNSFSGGTFTVQTSEDGVTYTDLETYDALADMQSEELNNLGEGVRYIKWVYTNKSSGNVALGNIALAKYSAPAPSITISPDSYTMDAKAGGGEIPVVSENLASDPQLAVVFVEADGVTPATYDWITATINNNGNIDGAIQANTGDSRTAYFYVTGKDANGNTVQSNLVTFTQEAPVAATPTIVFNPESIDFDANSGYRTIGGDYFQLKDFDSTPSLEILYYESDGDTEKQGGYDWLTADFNSNNQIDFTWGTNIGAARSAYLKIHAVGTTVYSNLFTVNQAAANVAHYYQKVTADADLADGQYLIVYEEGTVAFDGGLSTLDATSNTIDVTIVGDKIEGNSTTDAATFTIDVTAGTLQSASGLYIGQTSDANGLKADGSTVYQNTLSIDADGNADVISSSAHLRYNATSGQDRFRYFKSASYTGQKAIQLYKRVEGAMPAYVATPTFDPAAGEVQAGTLVTISTTTANATIRYTTDGSEPTTSNGEEYQKPIVINSDVTIKAIAVDDNQNVSAVAEATYTIATSSQLSPELTLDPKSLNVTEGAANGTVTVTTAAGYNGTITVMVDDPSVADASYDAGVITVVYGHAGSAVISVTAGADGDYVEQMEQISVNVSAPVQPAQAAVVVWSEDWSSFDLNDSETPAANGDFTYTYTDGNSATKLYDDALAGGTSPELLINKPGGQFVATIPLYGAYGNMTLTFKTNYKLTEVHAKVDDNTNNNITLDPATVNGKNVYTLPITVAEGAKQVVLTFTNNTSKNVRIDDFQLTAPQVAVNISSVGYATMYYGSSNLVVPAGVTASTYWVDGDLLKVSQEYTEGAVLAKAQGYVLNGAPGSYTFTATNDAANEDPKNLLCGSDVAVTTVAPAAGDYLFYLLGVDNGKVGFYWGKAEGAAFKSGAHKAYLAVPTEQASGLRGFSFDGSVVGINTIGVDMPEGNAYDLQGRRVQQLQKNGLYIVDGKKMLAK